MRSSCRQPPEPVKSLSRPNGAMVVIIRRNLSCSASHSAYCDTFACRLSHSCTLTKPLDGLRCLLACTLVGSNDTPCWMGSLFPGRGDLGGKPQLKHAIANCCCHLANKNEKLRGLATAIPPFTKLLWTCYYYSFYYYRAF